MLRSVQSTVRRLSLATCNFACTIGLPAESLEEKSPSGHCSRRAWRRLSCVQCRHFCTWCWPSRGRGTNLVSTWLPTVVQFSVVILCGFTIEELRQGARRMACSLLPSLLHGHHMCSSLPKDPSVSSFCQ